MRIFTLTLATACILSLTACSGSSGGGGSSTPLYFIEKPTDNPFREAENSTTDPVQQTTTNNTATTPSSSNTTNTTTSNNVLTPVISSVNSNKQNEPTSVANNTTSTIDEVSQQTPTNTSKDKIEISQNNVTETTSNISQETPTITETGNKKETVKNVLDEEKDKVTEQVNTGNVTNNPPTTNEQNEQIIQNDIEKSEDNLKNENVENTVNPSENIDSNLSQPDTSLEFTSPLKDEMFQMQKNARMTGAILSVNNDDTTSGQNLTASEKETLNVLLVNGVEIALPTLSADNEQAGFNTFGSDAQKTGNLGEMNGAVNKSTTDYRDERYYQFVRFGVLNLNNQSKLYVQGLQTPVSGIYDEIDNGYANLYPMPKNGTYVYHKGEALYGKDGVYQNLDAKVTADFSNKQLAVSLQDSAQIEKVTFSAVIDGNTFSGNNNGIESKGAFYGSRANQVGGIFYSTEGSEKGYNGVFGATDKQLAQ